LSSDATYGAAATAWNTKVDTAAAYTGTTNVTMGSTLNQGSIFTLTTSTDTFNGGAGDDTISGNQLTLGDSDIITGGAGTDTLTFTNTAGSTTYAPASLSGVENLTVTAIGGTATVNAVVASDITTVTSKNSSVDVTFSALQAAAAVVVDGQTANDVRVFFKDSLAASTTTANVTVKGGAAAAVVAVGGASTNFGTLNLASTGGTANTITSFSGALSGGSDASLAATQINITGDTNLTTNFDLAAGTITVDASAFTGNLALTVDTDVDTLIGGSGSDTFTMAGVPSAATDSVNGGGGTNTMSIDADLTSVTTGASITNIQTVELSKGIATGGSATTSAIKATLVGGVTLVKFTGNNLDSSGDDLTASVTEVSNAMTVEASGTSSSTAAYDITVARTSAGAAGTANVKISTTAIDVLTTDEVADDGATASVDESAWFTTLNLANNKSAGSSVATLKGFSLTGINISGTGALTVAAVDLVDASDNEAGTTAADRATQSITIDSQALTGALTFTTAEANKLAITLGAGVADTTTGVTNTINLGAVGAGDSVTGTTGALDVVTLTEVASTASTLTLSNIDLLEVTTATGTNGAIAAATFTDVGRIKLIHSSATVADANNVAVTGLTSSQVVEIFSDDDKGFDNDTVTLTAATGTTSLLGVKLTGDEKFGGDTTAAGIISTNATTLKVTNEAIASSTAVDNAFSVSGSSVTTLQLAGAGALTVSAPSSHNAITVLDATGHTGALTITDGDLFDTVNGATVTIGTASTTTTVAAAALTNSLVSFSDNGGTDTLAFATTGDTLGFINADGFETIQATIDSGAALSANLRDSSGYTTIALMETTLTGTSAADLVDGITLSNIASGTTVRVGGYYGDGADTISLTAATGSSDSLTLTSGVTRLFKSDNTSAAVTTSGFETVSIVGGGVTGTATAVDLRTAAITTTLTGATTLNLGSASATQVGAVSLATLAATSLTTVNVDTTGGAVTVTTLGTVSSLENLTITTATSSAATIAGGTAATLDLITASGAGNVTISALSASSLDSIAASGVTGAVTLGSSSTALTTAAGASIVTGTGNDTMTFNTSQTNSLTAGEKASDNDNLIVVGTTNSGTSVINLALADQIVNLNGFADAAVQKEFESVDVSAVTSAGSYGFSITAAVEGSTIVGSGYNDTIYGGAGADTITGGAGVDTMSGGAGIDTFVLASGSADIISDFATTVDKLSVTALLGVTVATAYVGTGATVYAGAATVGVVDGDVIYAANSGTAYTAGDVAGLFTGTAAASKWYVAIANTSKFLFVEDKGDDLVIWLVNDTATAGVAAGEVTLVGTLVGGLTAVAGDFI
jgi:hypothetical protein